MKGSGRGQQQSIKRKLRTLEESDARPFSPSNTIKHMRDTPMIGNQEVESTPENIAS